MQARRVPGKIFPILIMRQTKCCPDEKKVSNPYSHSTEREQNAQIRDSKESVLKKLYMHGYMNVDAEPMTFNEIRKQAKQLDIPDFDVMELDKYKRLDKKYKEPANCIIWIPFFRRWLSRSLRVLLP